MNNVDRPSRIKELDGLRGISVALVILYHLTVFVGIVSLPAAGLKVANCIGPLGVEIFFVISGFIITKLLSDEFHSTGSVSLSRFYAKRFFRIIPAYWFYLMTVFLLGLAGWISVNNYGLILSLLFVSDTTLYPLTADGFWFSAHTWSLSVEEQYYLVFPLFIWGLLRGNVKIATGVLVVFYFICLLSLKITHTVDVAFPASGFNVCFLSHFRYIIAGVLLAFYQVPLARMTGRFPALYPLALVAFLVLAGPIAVDPAHDRFGFFYETFDAISIALLVLWIMENPAPCGFLRWRVVQWVGKCSYSLYLWQQLFVGPEPQYTGAWKLSQFPYSLVLLLACAAFSLYFIERKFIHLGRILLDKRSEMVPAVSGN